MVSANVTRELNLEHLVDITEWKEGMAEGSEDPAIPSLDFIKLLRCRYRYGYRYGYRYTYIYICIYGYR